MGWHAIQADVRRCYDGQKPTNLYLKISSPNAREVTGNHLLGALVVRMYEQGDPTHIKSLLKAQAGEPLSSLSVDQLNKVGPKRAVEDLLLGHQGTEQSGGYTNFYRADVLTALCWAGKNYEQKLVMSCRQWLYRSYALDLLHADQGLMPHPPCSRRKLHNIAGRRRALELITGELGYKAHLAAVESQARAGNNQQRRRVDRADWTAPMYDDVNMLASVLSGDLLVAHSWAAEWPLLGNITCAARLLRLLSDVKLHSPLVFTAYNDGWSSHAEGGIKRSPTACVDAVAYHRSSQSAAEIAWERGGPPDPGYPRIEGAQLVGRRRGEHKSITLPTGNLVLGARVGGAG